MNKSYPKGLISSNRRLYSTWRGMWTRCYCKSHPSFRGYGGSGIHMCDAWLGSFEKFVSWAKENGHRPGLTVDRIDNSKGYSPDNCRWASTAEQARNRRNNIFVTAFGETKCSKDWERDPRCSVSQEQLKRRLEKGMSEQDAVSIPRQTRREICA